MQKQAYLQVAKEAAAEAGKYLLSETLKEINIEQDKDIKLFADKNSEKIIVDYLKNRYDIPVLTEESGELGVIGEGLYWIVDPIDGTYNYLKGLDLCCVSIALWEGTTPVLGVIYEFKSDKLYSGIVGEGAWCNGERISTSQIDMLGKASLATGFPVYRDYSDKSLMRFTESVKCFKKIRMFGTAATSIAYVAAGEIDVYIEEDIMLWDVAAGVALVLAAGGSVVLEQGSEKWTRKTMCFANDRLKEKYLNEILGN